MSDSDGDFGSFLSGFMIGGLVGAAVSLLLAPQSGEETRTFIRDKSVEIKDRTVSSVEEAYARAEAAAADAMERADKLTQLAKERADELKQRGQLVLEEQRSRLDNVIEAAKGDPKKEEAPKKKAAKKEADNKS